VIQTAIVKKQHEVPRSIPIHQMTRAVPILKNLPIKSDPNRQCLLVTILQKPSYHGYINSIKQSDTISHCLSSCSGSLLLERRVITLIFYQFQEQVLRWKSSYLLRSNKLINMNLFVFHLEKQKSCFLRTFLWLEREIMGSL
jgi:hypothetical protein